jgi:hypothetical protein
VYKYFLSFIYWSISLTKTEKADPEAVFFMRMLPVRHAEQKNFTFAAAGLQLLLELLPTDIYDQKLAAAAAAAASMMT